MEFGTAPHLFDKRSMTRFTLTIPRPCHENWESFRPVEGGRHCGSCQKVVIDFTSMTEEQIITYFKSFPKNTCGRFRSDQLHSYNSTSPSPQRKWAFGALITAFVTFLNSEPSWARSSEPVVKLEQRELSFRKNQSRSSTDSLIVRGKVISSTDQSALPGIHVIWKGSEAGTVTNENGEFTFPHPLKIGDVLTFSFIGLKNVTYIISGHELDSLTITMDEDHAQLSEVVVVGGAICVTRTVSPRRWWANFRYWLKGKNN